MVVIIARGKEDDSSQEYHFPWNLSDLVEEILVEAKV